MKKQRYWAVFVDGEISKGLTQYSSPQALGYRPEIFLYKCDAKLVHPNGEIQEVEIKPVKKKKI